MPTVLFCIAGLGGIVQVLSVLATLAIYGLTALWTARIILRMLYGVAFSIEVSMLPTGPFRCALRDIYRFLSHMRCV